MDEVSFMQENNFFQTIDTNAYFQSLPLFVQETIKQGGSGTISSETDLRRCAENLMKKGQSGQTSR